MLDLLIAMHFMVVPFVIVEMRFCKLSRWLSPWYFYLCGINITLLSFAIVNSILAYFAYNNEFHNWLSFLAQLSGLATGVLALVVVTLTVIFSKKLSLRAVGWGSASLLIGECGTMLYLSQNSQINWW